MLIEETAGVQGRHCGTGLGNGGIKPNFTCILRIQDFLRLRKSCQDSGFPQPSCALFHTNYSCNEVTTMI